MLAAAGGCQVLWGTASPGPCAPPARGQKRALPAWLGLPFLPLASANGDVPAVISKIGREILLPLWMLEVAEEEAIPHGTP